MRNAMQRVYRLDTLAAARLQSAPTVVGGCGKNVRHDLVFCFV